MEMKESTKLAMDEAKRAGKSPEEVKMAGRRAETDPGDQLLMVVMVIVVLVILALGYAALESSGTLEVINGIR